MPDSFDPYHKWLAIKDADSPPNHYRLLGLDLFELESERQRLLNSFARP